jgi:hypothetical protein
MKYRVAISGSLPSLDSRCIERLFLLRDSVRFASPAPANPFLLYPLF